MTDKKIEITQNKLTCVKIKMCFHSPIWKSDFVSTRESRIEMKKKNLKYIFNLYKSTHFNFKIIFFVFIK